MDFPLLVSITDAVERQGADETTVASLRQAYPDLFFTLCGDDDIPARLAPALKREGFNVYLADARDHCVSLTTDIEGATGVVFATVADDD
ncbi:MAG: DUF6129 family protein [Rhodocyclaceae bacterium]